MSPWFSFPVQLYCKVCNSVMSRNTMDPPSLKNILLLKNANHTSLQWIKIFLLRRGLKYWENCQNVAQRWKQADAVGKWCQQIARLRLPPPSTCRNRSISRSAVKWALPVFSKIINQVKREAQAGLHGFAYPKSPTSLWGIVAVSLMRFVYSWVLRASVSAV